MIIDPELKDLNMYVLFDEYKDGTHDVVLRCNCPIEGVKNVLKRLKSPYTVKITTKHLTIEKLGFKMVSRQCIGGIYVKKG